MERGPRIAIYLLGLAAFVTFLSAQLITPILPVLAKMLGAKGLDIATVSGAYISVLALFQIFTGAFADRYGKRRTIVFGASIAALSSISFILAWTWEQLLILRGIAGIADAIAGPALLALVAEISVTEKGRAMGVFRSSQGLAFILGPVLGGSVAHLISIYAPFYLDFCLTISGILIFLLLVREKKREKSGSSLSPSRALGQIRRDPSLLKIAYLGFSETFGFAALSAFLPALAIGLRMSEIEIAVLFMTEAIMFTLTSLFVGVLSDRIGRKPIMVAGLALSAVNFAAFFFVGDFWQALILMALYGLGSSSVYVMSSTMAADVISGDNRAMLFGSFDAIMDIGLVLGPWSSLALLSILQLQMNHSFLIMAVLSITALAFTPNLKETRASGN